MSRNTIIVEIFRNGTKSEMSFAEDSLQGFVPCSRVEVECYGDTYLRSTSSLYTSVSCNFYIGSCNACTGLNAINCGLLTYFFLLKPLL
jgi:hypothetical protein